jgi:hypothetical protein
MFNLILPKEADPRYIARVSEHDDDMSDEDWNISYGPVEIEGIDINVWNSNLYGSGPKRGIVLTAYPMSRDENGLWDTDTDKILFTADTGFSADEYEDEWFGLSEDTTPGEMPYEVLTLVNSIIKEISL